jgi:hypothetical protein
MKKIKDHWANVLDPSIEAAPFSLGEDAWLLSYVKEKGK